MEFERKAKLKDKNKVLDYLSKNNFIKKKNSHQIDTYYVPDGIDFSDKYLRVRDDKLNQMYSLDYHIVHNDLATEEHEVVIGSSKVMKRILGNIGLNILCVVDKKRDIFSKDNVSIILDSVEGLGNFIEVEVEASDEKTAQKIIADIFFDLGIDEIITGQGYPDMMINNLDRE